MCVYKLNLCVYIHSCRSHTDRHTHAFTHIHTLIHDDKKINQSKRGNLGKEIDNSA